MGLKSLETIYFIMVSAHFNYLKIMDYESFRRCEKSDSSSKRKKYLKIMKRVHLVENQYDTVLKKYQVDDDDINTIENDRLEMDIVDTKQDARMLIGKAFKLGIKYVKSKNDLFMRKEIKKELDNMIQALD